MAVLADQQRGAVRKDREHNDRAGVNHDVSNRNDSVGLGHSLMPNLEYSAFEFNLAFENLGFHACGLWRHNFSL